MSVPTPARTVPSYRVAAPDADSPALARHHRGGELPPTRSGRDGSFSSQGHPVPPQLSYRDQAPPPEPAELLADGLFLAAHDEFTGMPRLRPLRLGLGLASAVLAELVFARKLHLEDRELWIVDHSPPIDALDHLVHEQIGCEPDCRDLPTWLGFLRVSARDLVGERLRRRHVVQLRQGKRGLETLYVPLLDYGTAAWPAVRVSEQLRRLGPLTQHDIVLAGLMAAIGLHKQLLMGADRAVYEYLGQLIDGLPAPLHALVIHTRAEVDKTVSTGRRS
ncbi:MAG: GPP34 family phosphoprotein [Mycobacteriales bacterium]